MEFFTMLDNFTDDPVVNRVLSKYISRSREGMETYGQSLEANPEPILGRLTHLLEELMDATLYCEWVKTKIQDAFISYKDMSVKLLDKEKQISQLKSTISENVFKNNREYNKLENVMYDVFEILSDYVEGQRGEFVSVRVETIRQLLRDIEKTWEGNNNYDN
jgi:hypothetical protein